MWLIRAALRRPITVVVAIIAIALTAGFAVTRMRADIFPDLDLPENLRNAWARMLKIEARRLKSMDEARA